MTKGKHDAARASGHYRTAVPTAYLDTFANDRLPPLEDWPELRLNLPGLTYPARLNACRMLLDDALAEGHGARPALFDEQGQWTYSELREASNRIADTLVREEGLVSGNRVLIVGPNSRHLAAAWLAVLRAGGIAVTAMPLLRAAELGKIAEKAMIDHVLCDVTLRPEVERAALQTGRLRRIRSWGSGDLERPRPVARDYVPVDTAADDVALIAFTSGTTGTPKATMHFHRDILTMADVVAPALLQTSPGDVYVGTPPLGFTFGLGALLVFPLRFRAAAAYVSQPTPDGILNAVKQYRATALFTSPTMYRTLARSAATADLGDLRHCVSAGEPLSRATSDAWFAATGLRLIDGIGSTEMIHIFIGACGADIRPGATGKPLAGYEAVVLDDAGNPLRVGTGRLAVKGPTGCRYLEDPRQRDYVQAGWNITGDRYRIDAEGYFWFEARSDDMIISSGYNIAGPEIEGTLLAHPAVAECAVIGVPDAERGQIVKAYVVLQPGYSAGQELTRELQNFVKTQIAPYKYPRAVEFRAALPKTATGKVQRSALRTEAWNSSP